VAYGARTVGVILTGDLNDGTAGLMVQDADRGRHRGASIGTPSGFVCPDCGGGLYEIEVEPLWRFRCRVGHAYTAEVLLADKAEVVEQALWVALRTLEEKLELHQRMVERAEQQGLALMASKWQEDLRDLEQQIDLLGQLLYRQEG
jgi:two-component system chemotaxis response regulator CheB